MSNAPPLWEDPEPIMPPPPSLSAQAARKLKQRELYANGPPTDVLEWLRLNKPQHFGELMDLRKTLYSRRSHGKYWITKRGHTKSGEEKFVLNGPAGSVDP
jgi:hypothetical protein